MPWTAAQAHQHTHKAKSAIAQRQWGHVADSALKRGLPEGTAIREANGVIAKRYQHRQSGGPAIGGVAPSTGTANPMVQSLIQRFSSMSPEQLQEMTARLGGSQIGQLAAQVLNQKRMIPNATPQAPAQGAPMPAQTAQAPQGMGAPMGPTPQPMQAQARGGRTGMAYGGNPMGLSLSMADPSWTRQEAYGSTRGLLASDVPGRTDHIPATPAAESFVIPADVVSGLGEGNTLAGAKAIQLALETGPGGIPLQRGYGRNSIPRPPRAPPADSKGGRTTHVPIAAAGGEYIVPPETVARIGGGSLQKGHKILHAFVLHVRKRTIREMTKLKEPVKK